MKYESEKGPQFLHPYKGLKNFQMEIERDIGIFFLFIPTYFLFVNLFIFNCFKVRCEHEHPAIDWRPLLQPTPPPAPAPAPDPPASQAQATGGVGPKRKSRGQSTADIRAEVTAVQGSPAEWQFRTEHALRHYALSLISRHQAALEYHKVALTADRLQGAKDICK